jgi:hypothetical protein
MKTSKYQQRFYWHWVDNGRLFARRVTVEETDLLISTDKPVDRVYCATRVNLYRRIIRAYISRDGRFLTSLAPVPVERSASALIRDMAQAARKADVGPMAAVAGAIAQSLGKDLLRRGFRDVIVENGGDIFLKTREPVFVGVFAGKSKFSGRLRLRVDPAAMPCGICTSSATVGHSLSFGKADAVVISARSAALADAAATAVCNRVRTANGLCDAIRFARSIRGVTGALIILKNDLASWGNMVFAPFPA